MHWTVRNADAWMRDWEDVRDVRLAAAAAAVHMAANQTPIGLGDGPVVLEPKAPPSASAVATATPQVVEVKPVVVAAEPRVVEVKPIVVAEADLLPRDVPKRIPAVVAEPQTTGTIPASAEGAAAMPARVHPTSNQTGKTDRLLAPATLGRRTDREIIDAPASAAPPAHADDASAAVVVAMVRTGPGRIAAQSAIAGLGDREPRHKGRVMLPPVPENQVATLPPRSRVWAQPEVPALGYAKTTDVEYRFKALLGDEEGRATPPADPDDQLPP